MDIDELIRRTEKYSDPDELAKLAVFALDEEQEEIVSLVQSQILKGDKGDGSKTKEYVKDKSNYSPNRYVAKVKKSKPKSLPNRDYYNEGDFQGDMFSRGQDTSLFTGSFNDKSAMIEKEEGEEIFQLTQKNMDKAWEKARPKFDKILANELFG